MAGSRVYSSDDNEDEILFWVVVQACRDIVFYAVPSGKKSQYVKEKAFLHAYEWIMDDLPQDTVIGVDDEGEFIWATITFREALEELGVDPRNVEHMRDAIARGPGLLHEERKALARETYCKLDAQDNEPEPFWRNISELILNKEPA